MNKEQKIQEVQAKAKEIGHCLCNLNIQCPCRAYITQKLCGCAEGWDK